MTPPQPNNGVPPLSAAEADALAGWIAGHLADYPDGRTIPELAEAADELEQVISAVVRHTHRERFERLGSRRSGARRFRVVAA